MQENLAIEALVPTTGPSLVRGTAGCGGRDARRSPVPDGLRFDMFDGEFSHDGDLCTFEVLLRRFALDEPGLERIGQLVHDIDLKPSRHAHAQTSGVAASLDAIAEGAVDDPARVATAATVFDGPLKRFARNP